MTKGLPRYKCHKEVGADKIEQIHPGLDDGAGPGATLWLSEGHKVSVEDGWMSKHDPQEGGYYVVYKDGYASFSPAEAFESGYSRIVGDLISVVWHGWDLQNVPFAKDLLVTIPGDFSADAELLKFFYGEQWNADVRERRIAANPTRPTLTINQLPIIYARAVAPMLWDLSSHSADLLKAWIAQQNMDAQRMYNYMASCVAELAACKSESERI